jgi:Raf kinase inhibitor-like YbhB/YbcL family protein
MKIRQFTTGTFVALTFAAAASAQTLQISSPAFLANSSIPSQYTCDGAGINPTLSFSGIPPRTQSLVLIMDDPDVPKTMIPSGEFVHWLNWEIAADSKGIPEGTGKNGVNGTGKPGYMGPCPPDREHRYFFKLYALDSKLTGPFANKAALEKAMEGHVLQKAELVGKYEKVKK